MGRRRLRLARHRRHGRDAGRRRRDRSYRHRKLIPVEHGRINGAERSPGRRSCVTHRPHRLVRRSARLFGHVALAVADSRTKKPLFTLAERIDMAREALADLKNVSVEGFSGLLIDFVQQHDARVVLRGVRAVSDFDYEFQLAGMNRKLYPEVETVFMTPGEEYMFLSATLVREISVMGGDVSKFVSPVIAQRLKLKIQGLGGR